MYINLANFLLRFCLYFYLWMFKQFLQVYGIVLFFLRNNKIYCLICHFIKSGFICGGKTVHSVVNNN